MAKKKKKGLFFPSLAAGTLVGAFAGAADAMGIPVVPLIGLSGVFASSVGAAVANCWRQGRFESFPSFTSVLSGLVRGSVLGTGVGLIGAGIGHEVLSL